jgi:hypothetical protein
MGWFFVSLFQCFQPARIQARAVKLEDVPYINLNLMMLCYMLQVTTAVIRKCQLILKFYDKKVTIRSLENVSYTKISCLICFMLHLSLTMHIWISFS